MTKPKSKRRIRVFKHFKKKKENPETTVEIQQQVPLKTIEDIHQEVEDVVNPMRDNFVKIRDREGKLEHLVEQAERLEEGTHQFAVVSKKIRWKMWLRAHRRKLLLVGFGIFLIVLIVVIMISLWQTGVI